MKKIMNYFKSEPKISLTTLLILLLFFKYAIPPMSIFILPLVIGSMTPEVTYEKTSEVYDTMATNLAESFSEIMEKLYIAGQGLSQYSLLIRVLFYGIIWTTYLAIISFVFYIIRLVIYYGITSKKERGKEK